LHSAVNWTQKFLLELVIILEVAAAAVLLILVWNLCDLLCSNRVCRDDGFSPYKPQHSAVFGSMASLEGCSLSAKFLESL